MRHPVLALAPRTLRLRAGALLASTHGIAAVEFAMVLPLMVLMYLGMVEVTTGKNIERKLVYLARSLADLTGRGSNIDTTEMNNIFGAAAAVMAPYNADSLKMTVTCVAVRPVGTGGAVEGRVAWSQARRATARPTNQVVPVPEGFQTPNSSYVLAEVQYPYEPAFGYALTGVITMKQDAPWPIRNAQVSFNGTPC